MGKSRDDKCEVVGEDSFASQTGCRLSTVARVCVQSTAAGHSNTDVMTPAAWLWCHSSVWRPLDHLHGLPLKLVSGCFEPVNHLRVKEAVNCSPDHVARPAISPRLRGVH